MGKPGVTNRRAARWVAVVVALVVGVVVWEGSVRTGTPPAGGPGLGSANRATAPASQPSELRVATFNIHGGVGADGKFDLKRVAETLRGFDLIGLQEVRGDLLGGEDQARLLGRELGMDWLFAPAERRWWHDHFGNGLLSRVRIDQWQRVPLPCTQSRGFRNYLLVKVPRGNKTVSLIVTHIDRQRDHAAQVGIITEAFLALSEPAILMGDLNTEAGDPLMKRLLGAPGVVDAVGTFRGNTPQRIDWIFVRGMKVMDAGLIDRGASDHPAAWANLRVWDEEGLATETQRHGEERSK